MITGPSAQSRERWFEFVGPGLRPQSWRVHIGPERL